MVTVFSKMGIESSASEMKQQVEKCIKAIDTNGDKQITFEEFALWWLSGQEGVSKDITAMFGKFKFDPNRVQINLNKSIDQIAKTTKSFEEKDLKEFKLDFNFGDY